MFQGAIVAIVTPFKNGRLNEAEFRDLIEFQIENGTKGIVPCGTTGEAPTLSFAEHERVVEIAVEQANKRVPVIAGTGSNNTEEAIHLTKHAKQVGADAALMISPYYNKPSQEGLYLHFAKVAKAVDIPIIRTTFRLDASTSSPTPSAASRIAHVGIKEVPGR